MIVTCDQSGQEIRVNTQDLNPGTTYALRMIGLDSDGKKGKPSPELVIDTESVGCGPRSNKCNIMWVDCRKKECCADAFVLRSSHLPVLTQMKNLLLNYFQMKIIEFENLLC